MRVSFHYDGESAVLSPRALRGEERLGRPTTMTIELFAEQPVPLEELLGKACVLSIGSDAGTRTLHGIVNAFSVCHTYLRTTRARA